MRQHVIIATVILAVEAVVGVGFIGMGVGLGAVIACSVAAVMEKEHRRKWIKAAGVYGLLFVATMAVILSTVGLAMSRADSVVAAIESYHADRGCYPVTLDELVPRYLPAVPHAGSTLISRDFQYFNHDRPQFYFPATMHGVYGYDFKTKRWRSSE